MGRHMKKIKKIMISSLACILLIVGCYVGWIKYQTVQAENKIHQKLASLGIPKDELIVVENIEYNQKMFFGDKWYVEGVTTKKDYEKWKEMVTTSGKYLSGEPYNEGVDSLNAENCELLYSVMYSKNDVNVSQSYAGDSFDEGDERVSAFAYTLK